MNTNFLIEDREIENAQLVCKDFINADTRNRAVASGIAASIAQKFFENTTMDIDIKTGLFDIEEIAKDYQISDIYINGNYVDTRVYFNEKEICVPKSHFDNNILPTAYMFIKISSDLTSAVVTGFMLPDTITRISDNNGYYFINKNVLSPFEEIEYLFRYNDDLYNVDESEIFDFIENPASEGLKFIKKLILSKDGRIRFKKAYTAQKVLSSVTVPDMQGNAEISENDENKFSENFADLLKNDDEADEEYNFSTVVTPVFKEEEEEEAEENITDIEESEPTETSEFDLSGFVDETAADIDEVESDKIEDIQPALDENEQTADEEEVKEEIDVLFEEEQESSEFRPQPKNKSGLLPIILLLLVIGGTGYFGYTKFSQPKSELPENIAQPVQNEQPVSAQTDESEAMPVETVEKTSQPVAQNEGTAVSIPAIEQNLDASILVSNLRVDWEVPSGYASNTQVKRYLIKLGKIIQLNLKTELLLLNKPPISNKIAVELKYNPTSGSFETAEIIASSGEKVVDELIMQTVQKALSMKLNINTDSFGKLSGNPVLIIKL